jgi:hypothetical protein
MNIEERIEWLNNQAAAIEEKLDPQKDPHEWEGERLMAATMRHLAELWSK